MFDSEILCFSFDASGGSATILRPEEIDTLVDNPQFLGVEWLNYSDLSLFLPKILMPKFLPPASQLSLFEKLQQGLIGFRDLNDQGSIRETEVIVAELLRRYGYKTRLTRLINIS